MYCMMYNNAHKKFIRFRVVLSYSCCLFYEGYSTRHNADNETNLTMYYK